jgi:hypothetical protein
VGPQRANGSADQQSTGAGPGLPVRITAAAAPLSDDVSARARRYLVQMTIRVVCFLGAVAIDHWTRWVLLAGAVVLPYVAVVLANAGRERRSDPGTYLPAPSAPVLPPGRGPARDRGAAD